ncbi:ankyrin repeat domain-containing protein [Luteimonas aestuarii]|uniref:Ankyrin repeat domain-containing protein n=1 Tax=Luteimonas aestuarii TaxID=453837 RepID=A0A4R5U4L8_9GAMM|nr:ankyrin repeat domain-containing protein [Luteimonas aestuarii]TDK28533.1 ankyrin repeat domain-containing protein [Luteimonas aestuarii]
MDNRWMRAARVGDTDELRQLLEAGMDPGRYVLVDQGMVSTMAEQVTALHLAAFGGHLAACRLLLANGAEVDALTLPLERRESGDTALMRAVWGCSIAVAELLLEAGADVDDVDGLTGDTPLLAAARSGHPSMCLLLLDNGADLYAFNQDGEGAMDLAADSTTLETLQVWKASKKAEHLAQAWATPLPDPGSRARL